MRWLRLFLLGLASIYPIYWTAQFTLFFLPAAVRSLALQLPLTVVDLSYLQATALAGKSETLPVGLESLAFASFFSLIIWYLRGDTFLTGGLAIVVLGQSALLPFLNQLFWQDRITLENIAGLCVAMAVICFGLYRILARTGGADFVDRLALLSLLVVLPQAILWLAFRLNYPYFGTKFLLMLLAPVYLSALIVSLIPRDFVLSFANTVPTQAPISEILACLVVAGLLFAAIGITTRYTDRHHPIAARTAPPAPAS